MCVLLVQHAHALELLSDMMHDGAHVLDVGSGSGYLTACMAMLVTTWFDCHYFYVYYCFLCPCCHRAMSYHWCQPSKATYCTSSFLIHYLIWQESFATLFSPAFQCQNLYLGTTATKICVSVSRTKSFLWVIFGIVTVCEAGCAYTCHIKMIVEQQQPLFYSHHAGQPASASTSS